MALTTTEKKEIFNATVEGKNFMTPRQRGFYGNGEIIAEVSSGTGFNDEPIYGVTFIQKIDGVWTHVYWGSCVRSIEKARMIAKETCKAKKQLYDLDGKLIISEEAKEEEITS